MKNKKDKKNKSIYILLAFVIAIVIVVCVIINNTKKKRNEEQNQGATNENSVTRVEAPVKELPGETDDIELYVGERKIQSKYDKSASKEEQIKRILEKIGIAIGYKIETNKVEVTEEKIVIDFKNSSAPFNDSAYFGGEEEGLFISDFAKLVYTIFDSIQLTLKNVFGENIDIYYTVEGSGMRFNNIVPNLAIGEDIPYKK